MKSESVCFDLTEAQIEKLEPLYLQVENAAFQGKENRGILFAQIKSNCEVIAKFIPAKYTARIIAIMKEMKEEEKS